MIRSIFTTIVWPMMLVLSSAVALTGSSLPDDRTTLAEVSPLYGAPKIAPEVAFMRDFIAQVNPGLLVEDATCALELPQAIYGVAFEEGADWQRLLALAWQESDFDCHAKNRRDKGGAYGAFQIRRLWAPVTGDPRRDYFDPHLAAGRAAKVLAYYRETPRHQELVSRRFRNPVLCLYNTGETLKINMPYCRQVGRRLQRIKKSWRVFKSRNLVAADEVLDNRSENSPGITLHSSSQGS